MMKKNIIWIGILLATCQWVHAQDNTEKSIEEVTLAGKVPQQLYKTGKNVTLLTHKDLEKYKGQSLTDVLDRIVGFQITGNFNNATEPKSLRIRGGKSSNVLILMDGIPLKDVTGSDYNVADLRLLSLENIESIEVLNGASSVLYGSNATVSVIDIKTKKSARKPVEGRISARGGSFSTFAQNAEIKGKIKGFNYQVDGFNEKSRGFSSAKGDDSFDKDGWEKQNLNVRAGYSNTKFEVNLNGGWNHHLYQYDTGAFADGQLRGNDSQLYAGGNAVYRYNGGTLILNTRYNHVDRRYQYKGGSEYQDSYQYKGDDFILDIFNNYKVNGFLDFVAGFQFEKQSMAYLSVPWDGTQLEDVLKFDDTNTSTYEGYVKASVHYEGCHLDAGTRITDNSKYSSHWVYSINPYYLGDSGDMFYKIGYSYATAFIAPTLYQNFGALPYILPNSNLKPETNQSHEIDLSFGTSDRRFVVNASLFQRKEKDAFAYAVVDFQTYAGQYQNVDRNTSKGFDAGFDYKINEYIGFGGNFSYVEKKQKATMLRIPKQRVNSYVDIRPFRSTQILISHVFVGKRDDAFYNPATYATENVLDKSYNLFNLNISQNINGNTDAFLNIGNIFNTAYTDVIGYTARPRNYTLGIGYRF
ncbi:TonB-dependent receptor plug domain-containing protein [Daejeonia sp. YH14]|uniref:TonB-dependent receptor plug domain-containing protein n=1 Tax=Daejeonia sp. YH14 TaxID=3439042 RepID=UPI003F49137C